MKKLEAVQMLKIEGGGKWDCVVGGIGMGVVIGVGMSALMGNPFAIGAIVRSPGTYANLAANSMVAISSCWSGK